MKITPDDWCITMGGEPDEEKEAAAAEYDQLLTIAKKYNFRGGKVRDNSL